MKATPFDGVIRRAVDLNFRYYGSLGRLTLDYWRELICAVTQMKLTNKETPAPERASMQGRAVSPVAPLPTPAKAATMVIEADVGSVGFGVFMVENRLGSEVDSKVTATSFREPGGGEVRLSEPDCQQWLRALNDVRLALSVRLGITDENQELSERLLPEDPRSAYVWVYQWLAYLQDSLIEALS